MNKLTNSRFVPVILGIVLIFTIGMVVFADELLQLGAKGSRVIEVQSYLNQLKYLRLAPTGYYGKSTTEAVKSFQIEYGLSPDGKIGSNTLEVLREAVRSKNKTIDYIVLAQDTLALIAERFNITTAAIIARNNLPNTEVAAGQKLLIPIKEGHDLMSRGRPGGIQSIPWSIVDQLWKNGEVVRVIDVESGKSFLSRRYYGYYHADVEPLTKQDTQMMLAIYGGHWSWNRRAVVVQVRNLYIAGSMNGMPHGGEAIYDNGFRGQFCIHFLGSKVHKSGGTVDRIHQEMIEQAAVANLNNLLNIDRATPIENIIPNNRAN